MGKVKDEPSSPKSPEQFEVETIIDKRTLEDGRVQYYLKWKGYSDTDNTWENEDDIDCDKLIREFNRKLGEGLVNGDAAANDSEAHVEDGGDDSDFDPSKENGKRASKGRGRPPKRADSNGDIENTPGTAKKRKSTHSGQVKPSKNFSLADLKAFDEMLAGNDVEKILEIGKRGTAMICLVKITSAAAPIVVSWNALKAKHPQVVIAHFQEMLKFCD